MNENIFSRTLSHKVRKETSSRSPLDKPRSCSDLLLGSKNDHFSVLAFKTTRLQIGIFGSVKILISLKIRTGSV